MDRPERKSGDVKQIGILGAGGWGTALSILLHSNGHRVTLWEYRPRRWDKIRQTT